MKIGILDTMFARADMGALAEKTIRAHAPEIELIRFTVPGIKDLPVQVKIFLTQKNCDLVLALGMPGPMPIDQQCAHEASLGIQWAQLMAEKPALEVFVHENEASTDAELRSIIQNRVIKHAINAVWMLTAPEELKKRAGSGERQGKENARPIKPE
ncbi:MAG: riboflavin synthase [Candidatus Diapherotrites archaeon]|nr:riboflavin synthase [Candidatus Diapherotrites archaeon]